MDTVERLSEQISTIGRWRTLLQGEDAQAFANYRRPRANSWELRSPALIVVDVVDAFVGPDKPILIAQEASRTACGQYAWQTIPHIVSLVESFRRLELPIIFTVLGALQSAAGGATRGGEREHSEQSIHQPIDLLAPGLDEVILPKTKASAFFGTPLASILIRHRVDSLVLVGGATSGCVRATAVDGTSYGFDVIVAEDACFDRIQLVHDVALLDIDTKYGRVVLAQELLQSLKTLPKGKQGENG